MTRRRLWKWVDAALDRAGLIRKSQQWVERLEIHQPGNGELNQILIELKGGFRWSGYAETGLPPMRYPVNPIFKGPGVKTKGGDG